MAVELFINIAMNLKVPHGFLSKHYMFNCPVLSCTYALNLCFGFQYVLTCETIFPLLHRKWNYEQYYADITCSAKALIELGLEQHRSVDRIFSVVDRIVQYITQLSAIKLLA